VIVILHLVLAVDVDGDAGSHLDLERVRPGPDWEHEWGFTAGPATTGFPRASVAGIVRVP